MSKNFWIKSSSPGSISGDLSLWIAQYRRIIIQTIGTLVYHYLKAESNEPVAIVAVQGIKEHDMC